MARGWSGILENTDKMMGDYKFKDTKKHDDPKMATIKLKANPKKG
jgi:hypothetical protein